MRAARSAALAFVLVAAPGVARAQGVNPGIVAGAAAAASSPAPDPDDRPLTGRSLSGWSDPSTGSNGRLNVGCGTSSEILLSGSGRRTFVDLTLSNESDRIVVFLPDQAVARFSNGRVRRLLSERGDTGVQPGWTNHFLLRLPDKTELEGQDWLEVALTLSNPDGTSCTYATRLERDTRLPPSRGTYVPHSVFELQFSGGARFATTGALGGLSTATSFAADFGFAWYPWFRHGFLVDGVLDYYGDRGVAKIAPGLALDKPRVTGSGLFLGWSVRAFPASWLSAAYQPSVGIYAMELTDGPNSGSKVTSGVFPLRERVRLSADFLSLNDGTVFSLTASLVHLWLPYGTMGGAKVAGNSFSGLLSIVIGG